MIETAKSFWNSLNLARRMLLVGGVVIIVGLACALGWWTTRPRYGILFSNLRQADAAEITSALDTMQVPHRFADGGATLLVPDDTVYDTRMKLVNQGVPHGGSAGFETFKDSDFGVTEFAQRVNYQRALQGELERTIAAMPSVQSARVHLSLRRATMFDSQQDPAKASVTLSLRQGDTLAPAQVAGIQRLVASAVEGLSPESVTVLGDGSTVLSAGLAGAADRGDEEARVEARLHQRIDTLLRSALGPEASWSASVNVELNYDRIKQLRDNLVPQGKDGNGLVTRQKSANSKAAPAAEGDTAHSATGSGEQEFEYAHSHEQEEVEVAPGRISRISVGVLVPASVAPATLASLEKVIGDAVGLNPERGDRLDIAAAPIASMVPPRAVQPTAVAAPVPQAPRVPSIFSSVPDWVFIAGGALALCAGVVFGIGFSRRREPRRLTLEEREALLMDVQRWINAPEHVA